MNETPPVATVNTTVAVYADDLDRIRSIAERTGKFQKRIVREALDAYESQVNGGGQAGQSAAPTVNDPAARPAGKS